MGARVVGALCALAGGAILLGQMKASGFPDRDKVSASDADLLAGGSPEPVGPLIGADIDIAARGHPDQYWLPRRRLSLRRAI